MKTLKQLYQSKTFTKEEIKYILSQKINWDYISCDEVLSEEFIKKFQGKLEWITISSSQKLSESFIKKFQDKVDWFDISVYQKLSEAFIEKHKDKAHWNYISQYQKLSESFIEKFQDKLNWVYISNYQKLSESFIEKHKNKLDWTCICLYQKLSEAFIEKHKDKIDKDLIPNQVDNRSYEEKLKDITAYANHYNLKLENDYLYCYREHDYWNRGMYNRTISYDNPGKYTDWKCDLDTANKASYGLGVFSQGNTPIRVHVRDWGIWVKNTTKGRVWAFEIL